MAKRHAPTIFDETFEDFIAKTVTDREPLVVILRGHLITEMLVNDLLHTFSRFGASAKELRSATDATYREKIDALYQFSLIEERLYKPLLALNSLRNRFAHLPLKITVTQSDERKFLEAFAEKERNDILGAVASLPVKRRYLTFVYGLNHLYAMLRVIVEFARKDGPKRFD